MITLKQLTTNHPDYPQVVKLYEEAFPENERVMDMPTLLSGFPVTLLGIYPEEELFAGFFLVFDDGNLLYLLFFATCPQMRSGGIGSKAMQTLVERYRGRQLMFCYESPWYAKFGETEFVLCSSEEPADIEAFKQAIRKITGVEPEFYTY